jgi:hypothetical protein
MKTAATIDQPANPDIISLQVGCTDAPVLPAR